MNFWTCYSHHRCLAKPLSRYWMGTLKSQLKKWPASYLVNHHSYPFQKRSLSIAYQLELIVDCFENCYLDPQKYASGKTTGTRISGCSSVSIEFLSKSVILNRLALVEHRELARAQENLSRLLASPPRNPIFVGIRARYAKEETTNSKSSSSSLGGKRFGCTKR